MDKDIINGFLKIAGKMDDESCKLLSFYVAFTRGIYLLHQQNHWDARGYAEHILFQRLYEETLEVVDDAAERVVGLCGTLLGTGTESKIVKKFESKEKNIPSLLASSLKIEKSFQELSQKVYSTLKEKECLTLGLDDMIMSQASVGESHIYLLQQALLGTTKS